VGGRTSYERVDEPAQVLNHIAKIAPRTVVLDVESSGLLPASEHWGPTSYADAIGETDRVAR
jgi:hypothetical protein